MHFDQENPTHRTVVALLVAALITFVLWGVWMSLGFVIGIAGWAASTVGRWLSAASNKMTDVHTTIAWIGLGCGAIVGVIIGFSVRVDRLWERFGKGKSTVEERPSAP